MWSLFWCDTSDCQVVVQFGTNDIYQLNDENIDEYVERYVKAVLAVPSLKTYLFCIFRVMITMITVRL